MAAVYWRAVLLRVIATTCNSPSWQKTAERFSADKSVGGFTAAFPGKGSWMRKRLWVLSVVGGLWSACGLASGWDEMGRLLERGDYPAAAALIEARRAAGAEASETLLMQVMLEQNQFRGESRPQLVKQLKACVKAEPEAFGCHLGLAELLGMEAGRAGMFKAMTLVDDVLEHFQQAVKLEPRHLRARNGLQSVYENAPAIAGGGRDKADAHLAEYAALEPQLAPMLTIGRLVREKQFDQASAILSAVPADADYMQRNLQLGGLINLAFTHIGTKDYAAAEPLLQLASERFPHSPYAALGLGRLRLEQGDPEGAVTLLERALEIDPNCGAQYRLGLALEQLDRKPEAIAQYQRFLQLENRVGKDVIKLARARLKALGG